MKITGAAILTFVASSQALRFLDHLANYTVAAYNVDKNIDTLAEGPPPPLPPRPAPKPPSEPYLSLFANADDVIWEKAKCKGSNFMWAMRGSDRDAGKVYVPPQDSAASKFEHLDFGTIAQLDVQETCTNM
jgi:hypothetical protein